MGGWARASTSTRTPPCWAPGAPRLPLRRRQGRRAQAPPPPRPLPTGWQEHGGDLIPPLHAAWVRLEPPPLVPSPDSDSYGVSNFRLVYIALISIFDQSG